MVGLLPEMAISLVSRYDGYRVLPVRGTYLSSLLNNSVFCWLTALSNHAARATSMATGVNTQRGVDARERMILLISGQPSCLWPVGRKI